MNRDAQQKPKTGFGARLKRWRMERGLSGAELGAGLAEDGKDVTRQSVSDWESERHYPKLDQLRLICQRLNVSADVLIFGESPPAQRPALGRGRTEVALRLAEIYDLELDDTKRKIARSLMNSLANPDDPAPSPDPGQIPVEPKPALG